MTKEIYVKAHYRTLGTPQPKWILIHVQSRYHQPKYVTSTRPTRWTTVIEHAGLFLKRKAKAHAAYLYGAVEWGGNHATLPNHEHLFLMAVR